ncbi:hypothetical protein FA15DRAFT_290356 [Coprinopsis marcescibilis]|uniref:Uncharacterized protein n=1 Tax=Coprinopsis marcescibilis TaxID=230819 RepID=A0A5C3LD76_COPMA|nr:hypothetical protein FA15DRAFT_290356 [Coprinopsis marcescibilis]
MPTLSDTFLRAVATTTLYRTPVSTVVPPEEPKPRVPIAAIAGGVIAGALLAIMVTIGWIWWGRSLDRSAAKERRDAATRTNTLRNANISRPRVQTRYRTLYQPRPVEKQVKFVNQNNMANAILQVPAPPPTRVQRLKAMTGFHEKDVEQGCGNGGERLPPPAVAHQSSRQTMSSTSEYSTASGEEHQVRAPANLLLAALGGLSYSNDAPTQDDNSSRHRWSWSSSLGIFTRHNRNGRGNSRVSQYSGTSDASNRAVVMGVAM